MSYIGWASVLLNSLAATVIAFVLPRISLGEKSSEEGRIPSWILFIGFGLIALSAWRLSCIDCSMGSAMQAIWLSALALAGTGLKWVLTIIASRGRSLHERSLLWALLFSPLGLFFLNQLLPESEFLAFALCWFSNGFFWQAVCDDSEKIFA